MTRQKSWGYQGFQGVMRLGAFVSIALALAGMALAGTLSNQAGLAVTHSANNLVGSNASARTALGSSIMIAAFLDLNQARYREALVRTRSWLDTLEESTRAQIEIVPGDVRDPFLMDRVVEGVEIIFHLAALIGIPYSYVAPHSYIDTNITGTLNILQAARRHRTARVLVTSTSEVYGSARYTPIDENHPFQGQSPYSASKIASDRLAESFWRSFGLPVTIVRPFNTYGPRQSARAIIPTIITQLLSGAKCIKLGSVTPVRDLNFVKDTCAGFLAIAATKQTIGQEINIATGRGIRMDELARILIAQINPRARIALDAARVRPARSEVDKLIGCNTKITRLTGWKPRVTLENGLQETVSWFRVNMDQYKPEIYHV